MSSSTTLTTPPDTASPGAGIVTTTFNSAGATWTALIDIDQSTTITLYKDGASTTPSETPRPTRTRTSWPQPSSTQETPRRTPGSLYLLTFAVTLSLLLTISLIIFLRNLVLRRRERRIRDAVAAGLIPVEALNWIWRSQLGLSRFGRWGGDDGRASGTIPPLGPQPIVWDSWVARNGVEKRPTPQQVNDAAIWAGMTPLSITPLPNVRPVSATESPSPVPPRRTFIEFLFHLPQMPYIPPLPPPATALSPSGGLSENPAAEQARQERMIAELFPDRSHTPSSAATPPPGVRVALFVAMPRDPRRAQMKGDEATRSADVDVALGTSDVGWNVSRPSASVTSGRRSNSGLRS